MHSLIASRLAQQDGEDRRHDAHDMLEILISSISRMSGYAAMGLALAGLLYVALQYATGAGWSVLVHAREVVCDRN